MNSSTQSFEYTHTYFEPSHAPVQVRNTLTTKQGIRSPNCYTGRAIVSSDSGVTPLESCCYSFTHSLTLFLRPSLYPRLRSRPNCATFAITSLTRVAR